jgi:hypothetical protein
MQTHHEGERIHRATHRLLDMVWTLEFIIYHEHPRSVEILSYGRTNPIGYKQEGTLPTCRLVESPQRQAVVAVDIDHSHSRSPYGIADGATMTRYEVRNPQHIFNYSEEEANAETYTPGSLRAVQ